MSRLYIGIMSGTSLDGVDVALCEIDEKSCILKASYFLEMPLSLKDEIILMINASSTLKAFGELNNKLALLFAQGVNRLLEKESLSPLDVVAIGSHGQTLWHEPNSENPFSMQLGNPSLLAVETGIDVVADFRSKDVAYGGQGAPFAPAFHQFLFADIKDCAVLNIGGMANVSILGENLIGYDTGCGNVLMDMWIQEQKNQPYDKNGIWAKSGKIHTVLLKKMLQDRYFSLKFPKSTGREYFNKNFLIKYLEPLGRIPSEDVQSTLLALTAYSIVNEIKKFKIKTLLVCGGGVYNTFLMSTLEKLLPAIEVKSTEAHNVSAENLEAMIFAWFAYKRLRQESIELKSVTGAKNNTILGGIYATN